MWLCYMVASQHTNRAPASSVKPRGASVAIAGVDAIAWRPQGSAALEQRAPEPVRAGQGTQRSHGSGREIHSHRFSKARMIHRRLWKTERREDVRDGSMAGAQRPRARRTNRTRAGRRRHVGEPSLGARRGHNWLRVVMAHGRCYSTYKDIEHTDLGTMCSSTWIEGWSQPPSRAQGPRSTWSQRRPTDQSNRCT